LSVFDAVFPWGLACCCSGSKGNGAVMKLSSLLS
jgi:hypothetical protein